jgi:2-methylcitrate dehydratase PrpD
MLARPLDSKRAPRTMIDAKFSSPFVAALALVRGRVTLADFTPESLADEAVLAVARVASHSVSDRWTSAASGALEVELGAGEILRAEAAVPLGAPSRPLSWDALIEKAVTCFAVARTPLAPAKARALAAVIQELDARDDAVAGIFSAVA